MKVIIKTVDKLYNQNKYDVSFEPDGDTWITVDADKFGVPARGDIIEFDPPKIKRLIKVNK